MKVFVKDIFEIEKISDLVILKFIFKEHNVYPGQFFMIGPLDFKNKDFILNRPFSVSNYSKNIIEFKIRKAGKFTNFLSNLNKGDRLRILGPFGKYIDDKELFKYKKIILLGGGIGVAPLIYFYNFLKNTKKIDVSFAVGLSSRDYLHYLNGLNLSDITIFSDNGSIGRKGFVTNFLEDFFDKKNSILIIACGPVTMYKTLIKYRDRFNIKVLLENKMACGFGVCLGCVVETDKGFKRVCVEGPIFDLESVKW